MEQNNVKNYLLINGIGFAWILLGIIELFVVLTLETFELANLWLFLLCIIFCLLIISSVVFYRDNIVICSLINILEMILMMIFIYICLYMIGKILGYYCGTVALIIFLLQKFIVIYAKNNIEQRFLTVSVVFNEQVLNKKTDGKYLVPPVFD